MRILKVDLEGFGIFSAPRSVSFSGTGLNVVYGSNESGKSTLMTGIFSTIFGFEKKDDEENHRSWNPSRSFRASVQLEDARGTLTFFRDFDSNGVVVTNQRDGKTTELFRGEVSPRSRSELRRDYNTLLQELFGFADGELATKTYFVGQLELQTEISPALRGLISGAGPTDYHGAIELLKKKLEALTMEDPWGGARRRNKREIEKTQDLLQEKRDEQRLSESLFATGAALKTGWDKLEEEIKSLKESRQQERSLLERLEMLARLQGSLREAEKLRDSEVKSKEDSEKIKRAFETTEEKLEKEFPLFAGVTSDVSSLLSHGASLEDELNRSRREALEAETFLKLSPSPAPVLWIFGPVVLVFLALLLFLAPREQLGLSILVGLVATLVLGALVFFSSGRKKKGAVNVVQSLDSLRRKVAGLETEKSRLLEQVCASFPESRRSLVTGRSMREVCGEYDRFREARKRMEELARGLTDEETSAREGAYIAAIGEAATIRTRLDQFLEAEKELLPLADEPEKAARMAAQAAEKIKEIDGRIEGLDSELRQKQMDYAKLSATVFEAPEVYQEEMERLEKTLTRLTLKKDALKLAVDTLEGCVRDYQSQSMGRISENISRLFTGMTGERYTGVRLEEDLRPVLKVSPELEIDPDQISAGARDQLYFSMRIAIIEQLSREKGLPLILDDPFVNFDDHRLEKAGTMLAHLARDRNVQIILFTHGHRHLEWDAHLIRLDES